MTHAHPIARHAHRRATALLLAAVALPSTAWAQETVAPPVITVPVQSAPAPAPVSPPVVAAPAPVAQPAPVESRTTIAPGVAEQAQQEARERAAAQRAEARRAEAARPATAPAATRATARPASVAAPAPVTEVAPVVTQPVTPPPVEVAPPVVEAEAPAVETETAPQPAESNAGMWLMLAGLGLAAAAIAAFLMLRRRREDEVYEEEMVAAPVAVRETPVVPEPRAADPVAAVPLFTPHPVTVADDNQPALENATLTTPDAEDIDAVLGDSGPQGDRPQLELAMRPIRAGVNRDEGVVEFELTVANAGGAAAEDVRIGAFMLSGRPGQGSEIEQLLIDPPAERVIDADSIAPGDGKRLDAAATLPRDALHVADDGEGHTGFTPVLLADARYRLPDGREGRTAAAFAIGRINGGETLMPIALEDEPAMYADIEARLHSVPAKV